MPPSSFRYPSLNGLRAISILLVLIHHINIREHIFDGIKFIWIRPITDFLRDGQFGVNVFFVISGFLITSLMLLEEERSGTLSVKNFFARRVLRIFPAYFFLLSVYAILQIFGVISLTRESWITSLTYTKYLNHGSDWVTIHAWSLSVEENFYLIWPVIFCFGDRVRKNAAWILFLIVPLLRIYIAIQPVYWISELSVFTRIDAIATGCLLAFYKDRILSKGFIRQKNIFGIAAILVLALRYGSGAARYFHAEFLFVPFGYTHGTIANALIGFFLLHSISVDRGKWFDFLNSRLMNYIGILSYSIYLWQQIFFSGMNYWIFQFPQNIFFVMLTAMFSYYVIERPFLSLKKRYSENDKRDTTEKVIGEVRTI